MAATAAGPQPVADVQISTGQVAWKTYVDAEGWTLSVSGQGIYLREQYDDAGEIRLSPIGPDSERLPDGRYNWELRAVNPAVQQSLETRRAPTRQRQVVRTETEHGYFERRVVERPVVTSGSFQIQSGAFVMPSVKGETALESGIE